MAELGEPGKSVDEEKVEKTAEKVSFGVKFDESLEEVDDAETSVLELKISKFLLKRFSNNAFRSIIPPNFFKYFVGFFGGEGNYNDLHFNENKKEPVEEIVDVSREMNVETFT
ncbi:hypothetical protein Hanom_Chr05g00419301 [Helianthus anomalus]